MSTPLKSGDRIIYEKQGADGNTRKLRGVVADTLNFKTRGEELLIPMIRPRNVAKCKADHPDGNQKPLKVRWLPRSAVRKLPD